MIEWAFRAYLRNWRQLVLLVVATRGMISLLYVLAGASSPAAAGPGALVPMPGQPSVELAPAMLVNLASLAIADFVFVQPTSTAAIIRASVGTYLGEPPSADRSIRFGIRRFGSILLVTLLVLATLAGLMIPFAVLFAALAATQGRPTPRSFRPSASASAQSS